jgi:1,4-alpha-glucan branching enzyme
VLAACGSSAPDHGPDYQPADFSGTAPAPDLGSMMVGPGSDAAVAASPDLAAGPPGLGSTVVPGGVEFQVWAPDATTVYVAGDWNSFSETTDALTSDGAGTFSGIIAAAAAGQSYQYVMTSAAGTSHKADPRGRQLDASGHSVIVDPAAFTWTTPNFTPPAPEETVIYEMHVGTFNVGAAGLPSKFSDTTAKLDYLAALGVNMIELMPPASFGSKTSWGYNPRLPFTVTTQYGTAADLKTLVDGAHARGMGVIIDVVHNHYDRTTPLWCFDGNCAGSGGAYFYTGTLQTTPWGPRPDYATDQVRSFIVDNALLWLGEFRCDGLRWDSVSNIRQASGVDNPDGQSLLRLINDTIDSRYPHSLQIAEDLASIDQVTASTASGGFGFDSQWDAGFFNPVDGNLVAAADTDRKMSDIQAAVTHAYNGLTNTRVICTEDHDLDANGSSRIPSRISPSDPGSYNARKLSTLGAAIALTSPGIPMLFMGQEFLESGSFSDTNPLDWTKATTYAPILQLYTDLIRLRRNLDGHSIGLTGSNVSVFHINDSAKVIAYRRWKAGGDDVIVLANFSAKSFTSYQLGLPAGGTWHVRLSSDDTKYSSDYTGLGAGDVTATAGTRDGLAYSGMFVLAPYSVVIASQ